MKIKTTTSVTVEDKAAEQHGTLIFQNDVSVVRMKIQPNFDVDLIAHHKIEGIEQIPVSYISGINFLRWGVKL